MLKLVDYLHIQWYNLYFISCGDKTRTLCHAAFIRKQCTCTSSVPYLLGYKTGVSPL